VSPRARLFWNPQPSHYRADNLIHSVKADASGGIKTDETDRVTVLETVLTKQP
jgi:hypothetical protein